MILHDIRTLLLAQAGITAVLPNQTVNRTSIPAIFCVSAIQGFRPPYAVLSDTGQDTMLMLADPVSGLRALELDIDVYCYDEPTGRSATDTIRAFFDDYTGAAGSSTIRAVLWQDESYFYLKPDEGRDTKFHVSTTSYLVQFE